MSARETAGQRTARCCGPRSKSEERIGPGFGSVKTASIRNWGFSLSSGRGTGSGGVGSNGGSGGCVGIPEKGDWSGGQREEGQLETGESSRGFGGEVDGAGSVSITIVAQGCIS